MEREIRTLDGLQTKANDLVARLTPQEAGATLITLSGELGAGKTAFASALAKALGVEDAVTSPTFVLEKIYALSKENGRGFARLAHIDAYRLKEGSELAALGFDELMRDPRTLVVLEWPERVADALPQTAHMLTLIAREDGSRTIMYG